MLNDLVPAETIVLLAGIAFTLAYLIINQVVLRLIILVGTALYIWYYWVVADAPLWTAIYTSVAMGTANLIGLGSLFWRQSKLAVPHQHRDIYTQFSSLPPGDFRDLVTCARRYTLADDADITTEGAPVENLFYVISGQIKIEKRGETFPMPAGVFVGEVAYLSRQPSAASTRLSAGAEVLEWNVAALRRQAARKSRFKLALEAMISRDLAVKVAFAVAPRQDGWRNEVARARGS
ncbi:cyclic nucleotide-binding domain-containing protein [uncultured Tateyamaria sp.]|uniref:Crp/Fnr family transcriptional regulator n=1 Tax=uncultured Tateyamaria sp. TaxID=455651 RepID=UPI0026392373|nr:cyclic nucleotide-binding domain-containing protein [uncultured Tateyamaria sp.]